MKINLPKSAEKNILALSDEQAGQLLKKLISSPNDPMIQILIPQKKSPKSSPNDKLLHALIKQSYLDWAPPTLGFTPIFDVTDATSIKTIISFIRSNGKSSPEDINNFFQAILSRYPKWTPFHQSQNRLRQIASNIQNIVSTLKSQKNAKPNYDNSIYRQNP